MPPAKEIRSATSEQSIAWDETGQLEVLTFDVGEECLAIEAVNIREILDLLSETRVPGAPPLVSGVINFRGKIIPLADLRIAFGGVRARGTGEGSDGTVTASTDHRIVVIEVDLAGESLQVGLRADRVHEVTSLSRGDACEPPALGMRWNRRHARCLVRRDDRVIVIPDLSEIFLPVVEAA